MEGFVIMGLMLAGVMALIVLPVVSIELARSAQKNRGLAERNAVQALTIARLQSQRARFEEEAG